MTVTASEGLAGFVVRVDGSRFPDEWWTEAGLVELCAFAEDGTPIPIDVIYTNRATKVADAFVRLPALGEGEAAFELAPRTEDDDPPPASEVWVDYQVAIFGDWTTLRGAAGVAAQATTGQVGRSTQAETEGWMDFGTATAALTAGPLPNSDKYTMGVSTFSTDATSSNKSALSHTVAGSTTNSHRETLVDDGGETYGLWNSSDSWWKPHGAVRKQTPERRVVVHDTTQRRYYLNGVAAVDEGYAVRPPATSTQTELAVGAAARSGTESWHGRLAYAYLRHGVLTPEWVQAEYESWHRPEQFITLTLDTTFDSEGGLSVDAQVSVPVETTEAEAEATLSGAGALLAELAVTEPEAVSLEALLGSTGAVSATTEATVPEVVTAQALFTGTGQLSATPEVTVPLVVQVQASLSSSGALSATTQTTVTPLPSAPVQQRNLRWQLHNPITKETWQFPINPNEMTSPHQPRGLRLLTAHESTDYQGVARALLGSREPYEWSFSGVIRDQAHHDALIRWAKKRTKVRLTDHLSRTFEVRLLGLDQLEEQRPTRNRQWRFNYRMTALMYGQLS